MERTRTLNETAGAQIKRRGFTIVLDYASTAFMIQGAILPARLADCGGILDHTGFSELMTMYVILSSIAAAGGFLLLRAFSP